MPPGGLRTYWTGCVMERHFWWCIMRNCRRHWCPRYDPSLPSSIPVSAKNVFSVLSPIRMATSSAQVRDDPPLTPSPQKWNCWLMVTSILWTRHSEPETILACHRSIFQDDKPKTRVQEWSSCASFNATMSRRYFDTFISSHIEVKTNAIWYCSSLVCFEIVMF